MEYPIWFVCALGIGVVFIGLVCIVILCKLVSYFCNLAEKATKTEAQPAAAPVSASPVANQPIENRSKIIAAVSAVIAEENSADISSIASLASFQ